MFSGLWFSTSNPSCESQHFPVIHWMQTRKTWQNVVRSRGPCIHCEWEFCKDFVGFGIVQHLSHGREIMHKLLYTPLHEQCVCVCCSSHPTAEIMHTAIQIGFTLLSWGKIQSATGSTIWVNCSLDSTIVTGGRSQVCFTAQHHHLFCWEFLLILPFSCYWNGTHEHPNSQCTYWPRSK